MTDSRYVQAASFRLMSLASFESTAKDKPSYHSTPDPSDSKQVILEPVIKISESPDIRRPPLDYFGFGNDELDELKKIPALGDLKGVRVVGMTAGRTVAVAVERGFLGKTTPLKLKSRRALVGLRGPGGKPAAEMLLGDQDRVLIWITANELKKPSMADEWFGLTDRLDLLVDGTVVQSLAVRIYPPLYVRLAFHRLLLAARDSAGVLAVGQEPAFPDLAVALQVVNAIWAQAGIWFYTDNDALPDGFTQLEVINSGGLVPADHAKDSSGLHEEDIEALFSLTVPAAINLYLVDRVLDSDWNSDYGFTWSPNASAGALPTRGFTEAKSGIMLLSRTQAGTDHWSTDHFPDPAAAFGVMVAHEIGHYLGLQHPHTREQAGGLASQLLLMNYALPCGYLIPAGKPHNVGGLGQTHAFIRRGAESARSSASDLGSRTPPPKAKKK